MVIWLCRKYVSRVRSKTRINWELLYILLQPPWRFLRICLGYHVYTCKCLSFFIKRRGKYNHFLFKYDIYICVTMNHLIKNKMKFKAKMFLNIDRCHFLGQTKKIQHTSRSEEIYYYKSNKYVKEIRIWPNFHSYVITLSNTYIEIRPL